MKCKECGKEIKKLGNRMFCDKECRKKYSDFMNARDEKKEEPNKDAPSFEDIFRLMKIHNMSYGKVEDAIRNRKLKVEKC